MRHDIYSFVNVKPDIATAFASSLDEHIAFVQEAGRKIGVSDILLSIHDQSKWSVFEFPGYANHFKGGGAPATRGNNTLNELKKMAEKINQ